MENEKTNGVGGVLQPAAPEMSHQDPLGDKLREFAEKTFQDFSRFRFAEEREWYEIALFYQRRQWLKWSDGTRRWEVRKPNPERPTPMPVTNYFGWAIDAAANRLAARMVRVLATASSSDERERRAADFAENAIYAIDRETGMKVLNPLLAKHTALWGIGCTKDVYDSSLSTGRTALPKLEIAEKKLIGCNRCGQVNEEPAELPSALFSSILPAAPAPEGQPKNAAACPNCGAGEVQQFSRKTAMVVEQHEFSRGKLHTEIVPIFEVYLPRKCQSPNLAKRICHRYRQSLGELRRLFGETAEGIQADQSPEVHELYMEALRSLINYNYLHEQSQESATVTEVWFDWDELPKSCQQAIVQYDSEHLDDWRQLGGYIICAGGKTMSYGCNPIEGKKPFTFFLWTQDPANVYPKSLGSDLVPLQKRLNRIDSLIELGMMSNAAGKWLWPRTQTSKKPTGSPADVIEWDTIGDGKNPPTFIQPSPFHGSVWQLRQTILNDIQQIALATPASQGEAPGSVTSFRGLAYLGAKAEEQINTQRFLWETAHTLRYEKCLVMARKWWDEPRKVQVAGPNGGYLVRQFTRENLMGDYQLDFVPDSSKPRSLSEKQAAFAGLLQAGMVDIADPTTRDFVMDLANLEDLNLADSLQYLKAERNLSCAKQGQTPAPNPFIKPAVAYKIFSDFCLTEEFEECAPAVQRLILTLTQQYQMAAGAPPPGPATPQTAAKLGQALQMQVSQNPLAGVAGVNTNPNAIQAAALNEGTETAGMTP